MYTCCLQEAVTWFLVGQPRQFAIQVRLTEHGDMPRGRGLKRKWASLPKWDGPLPSVLILGNEIPMHVKSLLEGIIAGSELQSKINSGELTVFQAYAHALGVNQHIAEIHFEQHLKISYDDIRERIEDMSAFRPDILVVQMGALELGREQCDPEALAKTLTMSTDEAFQEAIDLTVLLGEFHRDDDKMGVTSDKYNERLSAYNGALQKHCNTYFSYYYDKIPGFEGKPNRPLKVEQYSTNGFVPGPNPQSWGAKKLLKGYKFLLIDLPPMLKENRFWTIRFQEVVDAGPRLTLGQFHFKYSCLTPIVEEQEGMDA